MSIIGHRTHVKGYPHYQGTIVGTYGLEIAQVEWDSPVLGIRREPVSELVVLDETVSFDDGLRD